MDSAAEFAPLEQSTKFNQATSGMDFLDLDEYKKGSTWAIIGIVGFTIVVFEFFALTVGLYGTAGSVIAVSILARYK